MTKKGAQFSKEHRANLSSSHLGIQANDNNGMWKGENASYIAIHAWVRRHYGVPVKCQFCGKEKTTPRSVQWANIDHKYRRTREDWLMLCCSCHKKHDIEKGLIKVTGKDNHFSGRHHSDESKAK